jgi:hypothetical protein
VAAVEALDSLIRPNDGDPKIASDGHGQLAARQDLSVLAAKLDRSLANLHPAERLQQPSMRSGN